MSTVKRGDKICIFGFSRGAYRVIWIASIIKLLSIGAYTARALAGMIEKVGLLPAGNHQQVPFAYKMYMQDDDMGPCPRFTF